MTHGHVESNVVPTAQYMNVLKGPFIALILPLVLALRKCEGPSYREEILQRVEATYFLTICTSMYEKKYRFGKP